MPQELSFEDWLHCKLLLQAVILLSTLAEVIDLRTVSHCKQTWALILSCVLNVQTFDKVTTTVLLP